MIIFKFEDKKVEVPSEWDEVTVGHFIKKEFLSGNAIQLLSVLSGIPAAKLANTKEDLNSEFAKIVDFMKKDPLGWKGNKADSVIISGIECKIPKSLESQTFGQKVMFGQMLNKSKWHYDIIPDAVAIYLAPQMYPDDWFDRLDEVAEQVRELPISKVWSIADFFLSSTLKLRRDGQES